jgi:hypothetical protein
MHRMTKRLPALLPIAAVIAVATLPITLGFEGICIWNLVRFRHACLYGDNLLTTAFLIALLPPGLVGVMFVIARVARGGDYGS